MKMTYKFYVRPPQKEGALPFLYLRVTLNRKHIYKSIAPLESEYQFDKHLQIVKGKTPESVQANLLIKQYKEILADLLLRTYQVGDIITVHKISEALNSTLFDSKDFYAFYEHELLPYKKKQLRYGGFKKYKTEFFKLKEFRKELSFADIDMNFAVSYFRFLIYDKHNNENTAYRAIRILKTILNEAVRMGYIKSNTIDNFKVKQVPGHRDFLYKSELEELHRFVMEELRNHKLKKVALYFLFACYTGLRYSDIFALEWQHIENNMIRINMQKTGDELFLPLNNKANEILEIRRNAPDRDKFDVFRVYSNQKTNAYLKEIAALAGIRKNLTFHVARHTFATVSLQLGIPIEVVSRMLGHHDIKTTMIYGRIVDSIKIREMEKWNF